MRQTCDKRTNNRRERLTAETGSPPRAAVVTEGFAKEVTASPLQNPSWEDREKGKEIPREEAHMSNSGKVRE